MGYRPHAGRQEWGPGDAVCCDWAPLLAAGALGPSFPYWNPGIHKIVAKMTQAM